ncbi:MAG: hypothetical protein QM755_19980 [Luteolibacter sp.]
MKVIIPCCGSSSRFPDLPPKWMLPDHAGRPMIREAVSKIPVSASDIIVVILQEHEDRFQAVRGLKLAFGPEVQVVILGERTRSQSETVMKALEATGLDEPFLVKDSDNCFRVDVPNQAENYVCYDSLNNHSLINPRNKSYLQLNAQGSILNIKEKMVISDTFSVGGYYFTDPALFRQVYDKLSGRFLGEDRELYLSDVISSMILEGVHFRGLPVSDYQDWGTVHDWKRFLLSRKTYLVSLDGYLFERGSEYFDPTFEAVRPHASAVEAVKKLRTEGHSVILLSIRSSQLTAMTKDQLAAIGFEDIPVVFDCPIARWEMVTAPYRGIPFRTSEAYELSPDASDAFDLLNQ